MSYSYPHPGASNAYRPRRYSFDEPTGLERLQEISPAWATPFIADLRANRNPFALRGADGARNRAFINSFFRRLPWLLFSVLNALVVLWFFTLWWGERSVFEESLAACTWGSWEKWPSHATPHHVAFIADPQLVDPHTYPGRPWPLSTLTVRFTDQYLRRSFSSIQSHLVPDSVLFLGDLFDGGREWGTRESSSPEKQYQKYTDAFWKKEYNRFMRVFMDQWDEGNGHWIDPRGRRLIASLPGNHDLGFGSGVQVPVRDRFQTFFGKGNRVDVIGNHTFVSVDTVSLSAMDQPDPNTGSTGTGSGDGEQPNERIWKEAEDFLNNMNLHRGRAEMEELRMMRNQSEGILYDHQVKTILEPSVHQEPPREIIGLPAILLTHVPLYRNPATPCGPLREHYPPSSDGELEQDERNAITISGGYQYQNVLTQVISRDLVTKVGPNLVHVYSGDDHDYCEISHREFSGSPKEITVKSLSWAMGIRRPGFVLTSLWNPIDPTTGKPTEAAGPGTLQNHLCLLPDQLSIFIHYGLVLGFTLTVLLIRAVILALRPRQPDSSTPILPLQETGRPNRPSHPTASKSSTSSTSSSTIPSPGGLASRAMNANPRYSVPYYSNTHPDSDDDEIYKSKGKSGSADSGKRGTLLHRVSSEFGRSVRYVAGVVLLWYFFLIWRW